MSSPEFKVVRHDNPMYEADYQPSVTVQELSDDLAKLSTKCSLEEIQLVLLKKLAHFALAKDESVLCDLLGAFSVYAMALQPEDQVRPLANPEQMAILSSPTVDFQSIFNTMSRNKKALVNSTTVPQTDEIKNSLSIISAVIARVFAHDLKPILLHSLQKLAASNFDMEYLLRLYTAIFISCSRKEQPATYAECISLLHQFSKIDVNLQLHFTHACKILQNFKIQSTCQTQNQWLDTLASEDQDFIINMLTADKIDTQKKENACQQLFFAQDAPYAGSNLACLITVTQRLKNVPLQDLLDGKRVDAHLLCLEEVFRDQQKQRLHLLSSEVIEANLLLVRTCIERSNSREEYPNAMYLFLLSLPYWFKHLGSNWIAIKQDLCKLFEARIQNPMSVYANVLFHWIIVANPDPSQLIGPLRKFADLTCASASDAMHKRKQCCNLLQTLLQIFEEHQKSVIAPKGIYLLQVLYCHVTVNCSVKFLPPRWSEGLVEPERGLFVRIATSLCTLESTRNELFGYYMRENSSDVALELAVAISKNLFLSRIKSALQKLEAQSLVSEAGKNLLRCVFNASWINDDKTGKSKSDSLFGRFMVLLEKYGLQEEIPPQMCHDKVQSLVKDSPSTSSSGKKSLSPPSLRASVLIKSATKVSLSSSEEIFKNSSPGSPDPDSLH